MGQASKDLTLAKVQPGDTGVWNALLWLHHLADSSGVRDVPVRLAVGDLPGGLVLNSTLGWWWADPIAVLVIAYLAVREGLEAWQGDHDHD